MPLYMIQFAYTKEAVANLVKNPEDRTTAVKDMIEKLGGRVLDMYFTFGDYDGFVIVELPDNVTALAGVAASRTAGHLAELRTTVLMTSQDMMQGTQKAGQTSLRPPGA